MNQNKKRTKFKESAEYEVLLDDLINKLENPEHQLSNGIGFYYRDKPKRNRKRK